MDVPRSELIDRIADRDPIAVLRATPLRVEEVVLAPGFDADAPLVPGAPEPRTLLARATDRELVFAYRARQAVAATHRPESGPYRASPIDEAIWARDDDRMDPALAVAAFASLRAWNLAWLARRDLADWLADYQPGGGADERSLDDLVRAVAGHDLELLELLGADPGVVDSAS